MNPKSVTGPLCHDLVVLIVRERWPQLVHGLDYLVLQPVDGHGNQSGDPYFAFWKVADIAQPDIAQLDTSFRADESKYRSGLARHYRDSLLEWSDSKVIPLPDAPAVLRDGDDRWKKYRQALRDVPQQGGFPLDIDWPQQPADAS